ncbi:MAG TPA: ABC transporter ATP-binding protein, partial [Candidatus Hodarchaeales archaeon]|nr:ABC transporter ATP-binding protein [Candidatus Hodarchaeales archaeon]
MGWVFDGLEASDYAREYSDLYLLKRIIKELFPYKLGFFIVAVVLVISTALQLLSPLILGTVINNLQLSGSQEIILIGAASFLLVHLLLFCTHFLTFYGNVLLVPNFMVNIRVKVFSSLQRQDMKFYDQKQSGRLSSRVGSDAAEVGNIIGILAVFAGNFLLVFLSFIILLFISPTLGLIVLPVLPLVILFTMGFRKIARKMSRTYRQSVAAISSSMAESVEGIKIAKSYGREKEVIGR